MVELHMYEKKDYSEDGADGEEDVGDGQDQGLMMHDTQYWLLKWGR